MNSSFVSVAFYCLTVIAAVALMLTFAWLSSAAYNHKRAMQWLEAMDVAQDGQRYLGSRAIVLADMDSEKKSALTYMLLIACKTPSKRAFYLSVTSTFGQVTAWRLMPIPYKEMISDLTDAGFELDEEADATDRPQKTTITDTPAELAMLEPPIEGSVIQTPTNS